MSKKRRFQAENAASGPPKINPGKKNVSLGYSQGETKEAVGRLISGHLVHEASDHFTRVLGSFWEYYRGRRRVYTFSVTRNEFSFRCMCNEDEPHVFSPVRVLPIRRRTAFPFRIAKVQRAIPQGFTLLLFCASKLAAVNTNNSFERKNEPGTHTEERAYRILSVLSQDTSIGPKDRRNSTRLIRISLEISNVITGRIIPRRIEQNYPLPPVSFFDSNLSPVYQTNLFDYVKFAGPSSIRRVNEVNEDIEVTLSIVMSEETDGCEGLSRKLYVSYSHEKPSMEPT